MERGAPWVRDQRSQRDPLHCGRVCGSPSVLCLLGQLRAFCSASPREFLLAKDEAGRTCHQCRCQALLPWGWLAVSSCTPKHQLLEAGQHMAIDTRQLKHFPDSLWQRKAGNLGSSSPKTLKPPEE